MEEEALNLLEELELDLKYCRRLWSSAKNTRKKNVLAEFVPCAVHSLSQAYSLNYTLKPRKSIEVSPKMHFEGVKGIPYCYKGANSVSRCYKCSSGEENATGMSCTKAYANGRFRNTSSMNLKWGSGVAKVKLYPNAFK
ncbi:hypothetical protein NPIL_51631 [Nephila pilipes]|uniref:Uncharacterized protein n=1 Tax=Nephila pilipes TaxID=299642 RepID=A0A8X6U5L2_NEPPI|nr:hypothetical protein NPIL_51631 [Nephila pilipes]